MNNKIVGVIVVLVVILLGWGLLSNKQDTAPAPLPVDTAPLKIGAILPLTGPIAAAGEFAREGIELAMADLEKAGNSNVEIVFEDGAYDARTSIAAYNKLKNTDQVKALVVFGTPSAMALAPLVNADQMPMLALLATPDYSSPNDFTYRIVGHADTEAKFTSDILVDRLGKKRIGVMYVNNDYGVGFAAAFKKYVAGKATIVGEEGAVPGTTDYRAQLTKIKSANPDAILMATLYKEGGLIMKQAKEMGLDVPFMCGQPCDFQELITLAGTASEGLIVVSSTDRGDQGFITRYQEAYGYKPAYLAFRHYDAVKIFNAISDQCADTGYAGDCLKRELDGLDNFPGLSYLTNFDENGDINDQFILKTIKDGKFVPYE